MKDVNVLELDGLVISSCCSELVVVQCELTSFLQACCLCEGGEKGGRE